MERYNNNSGFSLIEVMVAIAIFSLGLLAVFSMQINSIRANTRAFAVTDASQLAFRSMEWELMPGTKDDQYKPSQTRFDAPDVTISPSTLGNAEKLTVTVKWDDKSISLSRIRDN